MNLTELLGGITEYDKKQVVEMKQPKSWLKSVSAFANGIGGMLIFGITDNETEIGIESAKEVSEFISQKIKEQIVPIPEVVLTIQKTNAGKEIILLNVMAGHETPYYYIGDDTMEAFVRVGNESVSADVTELKKLVLRGRRLSYDSLTTEYDFEDFSFSRLRECYKEWNGTSIDAEDFELFGIVDNNGKLTNAGAVLADDSPIRHSRLFCTRWDGLDKSGGQVAVVNSEEYTGSLIILLEEGIRFVKRNMKTLWKIIPNSRIEMPDYCERSVFESLVNALIHRDYLISGSEIHIDMFDDRLMICSPGGMPDGTNVQERDINTISSTRRNPVLADVFARLGYMEQEGSGLNKIRNAYEHAINYNPDMEPQFYSNKVQFNVTLKNLNRRSEKETALKTTPKTTLKTTPIVMNKTQKKIMKMVGKNPRITQKQIADKLGLSIRAVKLSMKNLTDKNMIVRIGSPRSGYWEIK